MSKFQPQVLEVICIFNKNNTLIIQIKKKIVKKIILLGTMFLLMKITCNAYHLSLDLTPEFILIIN